ncbi:MAG: sodium:solute symporter family transporter [Opitutaceae bacterium]
MPHRALSSLDWIVVLSYFALIIGLGMRFGRRQASSEGYFLGTRKLPGWAVGLSMFATIISSWAFLALPGKAWESDLQYLMVVSLVPVATWVAAWWVIPLFRQRIRLSAYEYLEHRFGTGARVYGNLAFLIVHFGKMAAILYLLCLALAQMTGWNIFVLIATAKEAQRTVAPLARLIYNFGEPGCTAHQRMKVALWLMGHITREHERMLQESLLHAAGFSSPRPPA